MCKYLVDWEAIYIYHLSVLMYGWLLKSASVENIILPAQNQGSQNRRGHNYICDGSF
jgi:hypothetical protein